MNEAAALAQRTRRAMIDLLLDHGVKGNVAAGQQRKALQFVIRDE